MDIIKKIQNFINYKIKNPNLRAFEKLETYDLSKNSTVVDLGAHDGTISEFFLKKGCKVFAFEPNPFLYKKLKLKKKNYKKLKCFNVGINSSKGIFNLYLKKNNISNEIKIDSQASSIFKDKINISNDNFIKIKCITLKEVILITGNIDLIKIDIEGAEYKIYHDLLKYSDKFKNCIIELHNKKLPYSINKKHKDMLYKIKNHKNKKKFNLSYI